MNDAFHVKKRTPSFTRDSLSLSSLHTRLILESEYGEFNKILILESEYGEPNKTLIIGLNCVVFEGTPHFFRNSAI